MFSFLSLITKGLYMNQNREDLCKMACEDGHRRRVKEKDGKRMNGVNEKGNQVKGIENLMMFAK